jgi:hypothetical protein
MTVLELIEALESLTPYASDTKPVFLLDDYDREFPIEVVEHDDRVVIQIAGYSA